MSTGDKGEGKKTASITIRVEPTMKERLEKDGDRLRFRSTGAYVHTLITEALAARDAGAPSAQGGPPGGQVVSEKLDRLQAAFEESSGLVGRMLDDIAKRDTDRPAVVEEIRDLRKAVTLTLLNVLVQIGKVDAKEAEAAVISAMTPKPKKPPG